METRKLNSEQRASFMKYQKEFIKETYRSKALRFNRETEKDLIEWLDQQPKYTTYVKGLIRADMEKHNKEVRSKKIKEKLAIEDTKINNKDKQNKSSNNNEDNNDQ